MFQDDLFSIISEDISDSKADFTVRLNRRHPIYSGHFPDDAITPGVCVVQVAVDLFSHLMRDEYRLARARNVKFLQIIRPDEHPEIQYRMAWEPSDDGTYAVKAVVDGGDRVFSKMSIQVGRK